MPIIILQSRITSWDFSDIGAFTECEFKSTSPGDRLQLQVSFKKGEQELIVISSQPGQIETGVLLENHRERRVKCVLKTEVLYML